MVGKVEIVHVDIFREKHTIVVSVRKLSLITLGLRPVVLVIMSGSAFVKCLKDFLGKKRWGRLQRHSQLGKSD